MGESFVNVTEGVGKKLHSWQRTVSGNAVEDEVVIPGEYPLATYVVNFQAVSVATTASHVVQLMNGATLNLRLRRFHLEQVANATAASLLRFELWRLSTAGTGGTVLVPAKYDFGDANAGASAMTLPTVKGTEQVVLISTILLMRQAINATGAQLDDAWDWQQAPNAKPIIVGPGTANGLAIKCGTGVAGATVEGWLEFVETSFAA